MAAVTSSPICPVLDYLLDAADHHQAGVGLMVVRPVWGWSARSPQAAQGTTSAYRDPAASGVRGIGELPIVHQDRRVVADASDQVLSVLRVGERVLCESMIHRVLQRLGGEELDMAIGAWAARRTEPTTTSWLLIAVDGNG